MNTISEGGLRGGNKKERENANWGPPQPLPLREHQRSFTQRCGRWGPNIHGQTRAPLSSPPPTPHNPPPPLLPTEPLQIPPQTSARDAELTPKLFPALFYPSYQPPPLSLPFPPPLVIIRSWHLLRCLFPSPRRNLRPPLPPPSPPLRPLLYRDAS